MNGVDTSEAKDEEMAKRMLIAGRVRSKKQQREADKVNKEAVIVQVQLTGADKERFLAYKNQAEFSPSNAEVGKKLLLDKLAEVQPAA